MTGKYYWAGKGVKEDREEALVWLRKAAAQIEKRLYEIGAVVAMEIGKNRMESLGDVQETADLISYYCDQMEANDGYIKQLGKDPLAGVIAGGATMAAMGATAMLLHTKVPMFRAAAPAAIRAVAHAGHAVHRVDARCELSRAA